LKNSTGMDEHLKVLFKTFRSAYLVNFSDASIVPIALNDDVASFVFPDYDQSRDYRERGLLFSKKFIAAVDRDEFMDNMTLQNIKKNLLSGAGFSYRFQSINLRNKIEDLEATAQLYDENSFVLAFRPVKRRVDNIEASVFRVIYETLGGGIFSIDLSSDGKVVRCLWSAAFRKLLGYSSEEEFSNEVRTFLHCIYIEDRLPFIRELKSSFKKRNSVVDFKFRAFMKNGSVRWFRIAGTTTFSAEGKSEHFFASMVNIELEVADKGEIARIHDEQAKDFSILGSISAIYNSMHLVDLEDDFVIEYSSNEFIRRFVKYNDNASAQMKEVMCHTIEEDSLPGVLEFTDLKTLSRRMRGKNYISHDMVAKHSGWLRAAFILVEKNAAGEPVKVLFTTQKIQEEKEKERALILQSNTDELTRFLNRHAFVEDTEEYNEYLRNKMGLAVIMMDLNGLKQVNDTYGHEAGDKYIKAAADCMKDSFGSYGHLYRIGGDEFCAVIFSPNDIFEDIKKDFEERLFEKKIDKGIKVTVSCGYVRQSEYPEFMFNQLLQVADERMYKAKADYYSKSGTDRRGLQDAFDVLRDSYISIYKINMTDDTYSVISKTSEDSEMSGSHEGFFRKFDRCVEVGDVHPDDAEEYLARTKPDYLKSYFKSKNTIYCHYYRRKINGSYKRAMMEIVPAKEYSQDNQVCFLFVKDIE